MVRGASDPRLSARCPGRMVSPDGHGAIIAIAAVLGLLGLRGRPKSFAFLGC